MMDSQEREIIQQLARETAPLFAHWLTGFMQDKNPGTIDRLTEWLKQWGDEAYDNGGLRMRKIVSFVGERYGFADGTEVEFDLTIRVHPKPSLPSEEAQKEIMEDEDDG